MCCASRRTALHIGARTLRRNVGSRADHAGVPCPAEPGIVSEPIVDGRQARTRKSAQGCPGSGAEALNIEGTIEGRSARRRRNARGIRALRDGRYWARTRAPAVLPGAMRLVRCSEVPSVRCGPLNYVPREVPRRSGQQPRERAGNEDDVDPGSAWSCGARSPITSLASASSPPAPRCRAEASPVTGSRAGRQKQ
jgi:hypothetical protein